MRGWLWLSAIMGHLATFCCKLPTISRGGKMGGWANKLRERWSEGEERRGSMDKKRTRVDDY